MSQSGWRNVTVIVMLGIGLMWSSLQGQSRRSSRSAQRIAERTRSSLQEQIPQAVETLREDYDEFAAQYLSADFRERHSQPLSDSEQQRLTKVLLQFVEAPVSVSPDGKDAIAAVEISSDAAAALEPPEPVKPPGTSETSSSAPGYGEDLDKAIRQMIAALEAREFTSFIRHTYPLAELKQLKESDQLDLQAEYYSGNPGLTALLVADLRKMLALEPELESDTGRELALYKVPTAPPADAKPFSPTPNDRLVILENVAGHWRFHDGNAEVREEMLKQRAGVRGEDEIYLYWSRTEEGWRIDQIPFF
ncbi:hypothetical protein [Rubinisphaera margarita]|uniref:hypothetical protein n=1 Tax=Rubinisphaera margarita TaxID=2909586 RepID=UPI001EE93C60|nr:hypothetical protein [Rubinisphaera margarita]MCG6155115.1 hypothetical protein [Rubinisphaera margarita]